MKKTLRLVVVLAAFAGLFASAPKKADAHAGGYDRAVAIWLLGVWLDHTYEYLISYENWGGGYATFGGGSSDGHEHSWTCSVSSGEGNCMHASGNLTYAITGVCHQGTNRGLQRTSIPYVNNWGDVGGSGTSQALYCTFGAGLWCYGSPC